MVTNSMNKNKRPTIFVAGLGATGSSAVIDLLKEVNDTFVFENEFRLLVDPGGLINLRDAIVDNWSVFQTDKAIKDYKILVKNINTRFRGSYSTLGHNKYFDKILLKETTQYLKNLTDLKYVGLWYGIDSLLKRQLNKYWLFHRKKIISENIYMGKQLSGQQFDHITNMYLHSLISYCLKKYSSNQFIFNENFSCLFPIKTLNFVKDSKMIVVIRDPRDVFATTIKARWSAAPGSPKDFIKWENQIFNRWIKIFLEIQKRSDIKNNILIIKFEDLINDYEKTKNNIFNFVDIDPRNHYYPQKYFNPEISSGNVKLFEKTLNKSTAEYIEKKFQIFYKTFNYEQ